MGISFFKRLSRRKSAPSASRTQSDRVPTMCEKLEDRKLFHVFITNTIADNRGEVLIQLDSPANASTVNKNSVQMYTAGPDGILANADDTRVAANVKYSASTNRITLRGPVAANTGYRVKVVGSRLKSEDGILLDGEFNGVGKISGNGKAGGNYEFQTKNDKSATPILRMSTTAGVVSLQLFRSTKPISVANILSYANDGSYDNIFFTRNIPGFIIQGGSLNVTSANAIGEIRVGSMITNEFSTGGTVSNTRGTVAFAKQGGNPNSATNQFFFNLGDNSSNLDNQNGGFTVFAKAANSASLAVMDALAAKSVVALHNDLNGQGVVAGFSATGVTDVPVVSSSGLTGSVQTIDNSNTQRFVVTGNFNPTNSLLIIRRTALQMKVTALA